MLRSRAGDWPGDTHAARLYRVSDSLARLPRDSGISSTYGGPITQNVADGEWQRWFMAKLFLRVSIHRDLTFIRFGVFRVVMVVVVVMVVRAVVFVMVIGVIAGVLDFEITHGGGLYEYPNTAADFSTHATRTMNARGMWGMLVPHEAQSEYRHQRCRYVGM